MHPDQSDNRKMSNPAREGESALAIRPPLGSLDAALFAVGIVIACAGATTPNQVQQPPRQECDSRLLAEVFHEQLNHKHYCARQGSGYMRREDMT